MLEDRNKLSEQATLEGTASESTLSYTSNELKSRFGIVRKEAALYFAYIANDADLFGKEAAISSIRYLLENHCQECLDALRCLGFTSEEVWSLKRSRDEEIRSRIEIMMASKGLICPGR